MMAVSTPTENYLAVSDGAGKGIQRLGVGFCVPLGRKSRRDAKLRPSVALLV